MIFKTRSQGWKVRPRGMELSVGLGIAAILILLFVRLSVPQRTHLIEYGVLAVLIFEAIQERIGSTQKTLLTALGAFLATSTLGAIDESIQLWVPNRVFDWFDIAFNSLAALGAVVAMTVLRTVRQWRNSVGPKRLGG